MESAYSSFERSCYIVKVLPDSRAARSLLLSADPGEGNIVTRLGVGLLATFGSTRAKRSPNQVITPRLLRS